MYGSRTRPGMARPHSDVDMVFVQQGLDRCIEASLALFNAIESRFQPLDLRRNSQGVIWLDTVVKALAPDADPEVGAHTRDNCKFFDRDSIYILTNPEAERLIKLLSSSESKPWSRGWLQRTL